MKQIQSTEKLYLFKFCEIKPNPTHFKIGEQILQYIPVSAQNLVSIEGQPIKKFWFQILSTDHLWQSLTDLLFFLSVSIVHFGQTSINP